MKKIILASACILALASPCRRADHQAFGWRVEPRQCWTRCIARRDEGRHRHHETGYYWHEQQTLARR